MQVQSLDQSAVDSNPEAGGWTRRAGVAGSLVLLALVGAVHGAAVTYDFVSFDDGEYVYANPQVLRGLTPAGVAWAFELDHGNTYFHPLTWLSLMLDRDLFGPTPWGFHLTNVLLHGAVVVLLFQLLRRATGRMGPSLAAAAVFAVHPITLESVAWVTERKTVLAAVFGLGALFVYAGARGKPSPRRLAAVSVLFVAAMASKAAWVVLPGLLLVLDAWPLGRVSGETSGERWGSLRSLVLEKWPMFALGAGMTALVVVSSKGTTAAWASSAPISVRLGNAVASVPAYLVDVLWPFRHAVFHPYPASVPAAKVVVGIAAIALVTAATLLASRRSPSALAGWAWFGVSLLPHLGLWQNGLWPSRADRFAYVAFAGLAFGAAFFVDDLLGERRRLRLVALGVASLLVVGLGAASLTQGRHWKDSLSLYRRAVAVEPESGEMRFNLGDTLMRAGLFAEGRAEVEAAIRLQPWNARARVALAGFLEHDGDGLGAEQQYREALRYDARSAEALFMLAESLRKRGQVTEARALFERFLAVVPEDQQAARDYVRALLR